MSLATSQDQAGAVSQRQIEATTDLARSWADGVRTFVWQSVLLATVLVVEGALISARFDAAPISDTMPEWWAQLLSRIGVLVPLSIVLGTAILLFAGTRLRAQLNATAQIVRPRRRWLLLGAHLGAVALFFVLTAIVFEGGLRTAAFPLAWIVVWLLTGGGALVLWFAALLPGVRLVTLFRRLGPTLPLSVTIGLAAWSAGDVTATWWDPLRHSTFWAVHWLLAPVIPDLVVQANDYVVGTDSFLIEVTPKCAGYEGMGLTTVFLVAYLWLFRRRLRFPNALLLLPAGLCLAWWANVVRIAALLAIGAWGWEALAVGGFHAYSGSILFCALALGLAFIAQRLPFFSADDRTARPIDLQRDPTAAYLAPLLAMVATRMVTGVVTTSDVNLYEPLQAIIGIAVLWWFRSAYRDIHWSWSWPAVGTGLLAGGLWIVLTQTAGRTVLWVPDTSRVWVGIWIVSRLAGFLVLVPLVEELAFRGYLTRRFIAADFERTSPGEFTWLSFLASSLIFGIMHEHLVAGTITGMCYAMAMYRRGRLGDAVLAHVASNALIAASVFATGQWLLWS